MNPESDCADGDPSALAELKAELLTEFFFDASQPTLSKFLRCYAYEAEDRFAVAALALAETMDVVSLTNSQLAQDPALPHQVQAFYICCLNKPPAVAAWHADALARDYQAGYLETDEQCAASFAKVHEQLLRVTAGIANMAMDFRASFRRKANGI